MRIAALALVVLLQEKSLFEEKFSAKPAAGWT